MAPSALFLSYLLRLRNAPPTAYISTVYLLLCHLSFILRLSLTSLTYIYTSFCVWLHCVLQRRPSLIIVAFSIALLTPPVPSQDVITSSRSPRHRVRVNLQDVIPPCPASMYDIRQSVITQVDLLVTASICDIDNVPVQSRCDTALSQVEMRCDNLPRRANPSQSPAVKRADGDDLGSVEAAAFRVSWRRAYC
ncbi:hypothetical protein C8R44DRAFT_894834 [Mycena epipterygia]|nr:hypothetical protein C8R44DRAFT_894834 [Mycena epipterygia]